MSQKRNGYIIYDHLEDLQQMKVAFHILGDPRWLRLLVLIVKKNASHIRIAQRS
jgi:hypothetical protein